MPVVVLHVPGLWHHPIKPIAHSVPERADGELESVPAILVGVDFVVAAVAASAREEAELGQKQNARMNFARGSVPCVMCDHCPSSEGEGREGDNREDAHTESHRGHAHDAAEVAPEHHFLQVADVGLALILFQLVAKAFHVGGKSIVVVRRQPLVVFGLGGGGVGNAHGCSLEDDMKNVRVMVRALVGAVV